MSRRGWILTATALVVVGVLVVYSITRSGSSSTGGPYKNLGQAVAAGKVSGQMVAELEAKGSTVGIVSFRGEDLIAGLLSGPNAGSLKQALGTVRVALDALKGRTFGVLGNDVQVVDSFGYLPTATVRFRSQKALLAVANSAAVEGISSPIQLSLTLEQSLPLIRADQAHLAGFNGAETDVAILDSGVELGRSAFGSCTAPGQPSTCAVAFSTDIGGDDGSLDDNQFKHGTNVSGIVEGVAPGTKILMYDVFGGTDVVSGQAIAADRSSLNNIIAALQDVLDKVAQNWPIRAVNMSLGWAFDYHTADCDQQPNSSGPNTLTGIFDELRKLHVLPVVSAGNEGFKDKDGNSKPTGIGFPACTKGAISVGAVYDADGDNGAFQDCSDVPANKDQTTCFSQTGPNLTLFAPGAVIVAAEQEESGTSQAAPHVAGAVAVLSAAAPAASVDQIQAALADSGPVIQDDRSGGRHRLDVMAALQALGVGGSTTADTIAPTVTAPTAQFVDANNTSGAGPVSVTISWTASDEGGSGIAASFLWLSTDSRETWKQIDLASPTANSVTVDFFAGINYEFAVQAKDAAGNLSEFAYAATPFSLAG